jgi:glycosyltransferase involved in cell wall biosynthesis
VLPPRQTDLPTLSVVIAARDALRWLPGAIASVGPRRDIEILVVDAGSADGTGEYLRAVGASDPRVRRVAASGPGAAAARNAGLDAARAALTAFLDADDRWRPGKLRAQLDLHRLNSDLAFSFTDHRRFAEDGTALPTGFARCPAFAARHAMRHEAFVLGRDAQSQVYAEPVVATSTVVARTGLLRAVGGFNRDLARAEGWDLFLHLAACGPVGCVPRPLADRLVRAIPPGGAEALTRRAAWRRVAEAYEAVAAAQDAEAPRLCRRSQLEQEADGAALAGRHARAALLRLTALARTPGRELFGRARQPV